MIGTIFLWTQLITEPGAAPPEAPPKKKLKTVNAPVEPVPVVENGEDDVDEEEFDDDPAIDQELEGLEELDEEDEEGYDEEAEGEEAEDDGVDDAPKKLGIDIDLPTNGKTQAATEVAANGEEVED